MMEPPRMKSLPTKGPGGQSTGVGKLSQAASAPPSVHFGSSLRGQTLRKAALSVGRGEGVHTQGIF